VAHRRGAQQRHFRAPWPPADARRPRGPNPRAGRTALESQPAAHCSFVHYQFADEGIGPTIPCKHIFCAAVGGKQSNPPAEQATMPRRPYIGAMVSPRQIVKGRGTPCVTAPS
jgi:hypothetical protein